MSYISNPDNPFYPIGQIFSSLWNKRNSIYRFGWDLLNGSTQFRNLEKEKEKLAAVLSNPAMMKVVALQCDLFSMGKLYVYDQDENEIENDPFLEMMRKPNQFQTESQFLWDFMFWLMLGTDYCYVDSKIVDPSNRMYHLDPAKIDWPLDIERAKDKLILSDSELNRLMKLNIRYRYDDGSSTELPLEKIIINTDLTNGIGNWFKGPSRIDALYKIISNSEFLLDAENINIRYSGKFLVGAENDLSKIGMGDTEKDDLVNNVDDSFQKVWAFKSPIAIRRFVDNFANLQLKDTYLHHYFLIGNMYNIPRDVLESYNSATYENQEKARAAHVNYCFDPKGNQFMDSFENYFGYKEQGKNIFLDWSHMPFMQAFEKEKAEVGKLKIESLTSLLNLGVPLEEINQYLDTNFTIDESKQVQAEQSQGGQESSTEQEQIS